MAETTMDYFDQLFNSSNPSGAYIEEAIRSTNLVVDSHMNDFLCVPFTAEEVHKALFDMHPSKAPGPDGFTAFFYQKLWPEIGEEITAAALSILNDHGEVSKWNYTLIILIPKIKVPLSLKDYIPISLCSTTYKIVSRAITNRFSHVLDKVIDEFQSAFFSVQIDLG